MGAGETILIRPHGAKVVGVFANYKRDAEPGLLALESDQRTLTLNGRNWRRQILVASAPINHVAVSNVHPYIAYSTVANEVVVYSLSHNANLCRYLGDKVA